MEDNVFIVLIQILHKPIIMLLEDVNLQML